MLLSLAAAVLLGAMPCHLSLLAPAEAPARFEEGPVPQACGEVSEASLSPAGRRAVSVLGGLMASAVGFVAGGALGYAAAGACEGCDSGPLGPDELWGGALIGLHLGAAVGSHAFGSATGGRGTWTGTVLGTLAGGAVGVLMIMMISSLELSDPTALLMVPLLAPTVGAVTGYAVSEANAPPPCIAPAPRAPALRLRFSF